MGSIYKRGKTYWIQYYRNGKPYRESTKSKKEADAKRLLKKREGEISDGKLPGDIGPPLIAMKARFPDAEILYRQIWDATERNPDSRMPPFGRHGILNKEEIKRIVEYLYRL